MTFVEALQDIVAADGTLPGLIGTKFYPQGTRPQGAALPCLTYLRVSAVRNPHQGGDSGLIQARYQFDAWAADRPGARAIARAVQTCFQCLAETYTDSDGSVEIQVATVEEDSEEYEPPTDGSEFGVYRALTEVVFWYKES